jgi:hypothetical protein
VHKVIVSCRADMLFEDSLSLSFLSLPPLSQVSPTYPHFHSSPPKLSLFMLFFFAQVSVAALLDNFIASSARMEEKERLRAAEEATRARHVRVEGERERER